MAEVHNPGSYAEFLKNEDLQSSPETLKLYSAGLLALRKQIADQRGIDLEDLHTLPFEQKEVA